MLADPGLAWLGKKEEYYEENGIFFFEFRRLSNISPCP